MPYHVRPVAHQAVHRSRQGVHVTLELGKEIHLCLRQHIEYACGQCLDAYQVPRSKREQSPCFCYPGLDAIKRPLFIQDGLIDRLDLLPSIVVDLRILCERSPKWRLYMKMLRCVANRAQE